MFPYPRFNEKATPRIMLNVRTAATIAEIKTNFLSPSLWNRNIEKNTRAIGVIINVTVPKKKKGSALKVNSKLKKEEVSVIKLSSCTTLPLFIRTSIIPKT